MYKSYFCFLMISQIIRKTFIDLNKLTKRSSTGFIIYCLNRFFLIDNLVVIFILCSISNVKLYDFYFYSPEESNRYSINCFPKDNANQKPRNLRKLENERQLSLHNGGQTQFTVTHDCAILVQLHHLFIPR